MKCIKYMHNVEAHLTTFHVETIEQIFVMFCILALHEKLKVKFHYWSSITLKVQLIRYQI